MTTAMDVPAESLIETVSADLRDNFEEIDAPDWTRFTKTGRNRELSPEDTDWWYKRTASILRVIYKDGPVGVSRLKTRYGGRDRKGSNPAHHKRGSGKVIRVSLQQLEEADLVEIGNDGRVISDEGRAYLDGKADEAASDIPELEKY